MNLGKFTHYFKPVPTVILLALAAPFLFIGITELRKSQSLIKNFSTTTGTITGTNYLRNVDTGESAESTWLIYPVVRFTTPLGKVVSFTDRVGSYPAEYEVGDRVKVLYNPDNPQEATIQDWKQIWFAPLWITAIGFLPILGLLGWAAWQYRRAKRVIKTSCKAKSRYSGKS